MKTNVIFFWCMIFAVIASSQEPETNVKEIKVTAPKFAGIENAAAMLNQKNQETINEYLEKNFEYSGHQLVEGTVVVQFTVTPSGELTDFAVINSISREVDKEIIRLLGKTNGMWIPGYNNNVPAAMTKEVSLAFFNHNNGSKSINEIFTEKATNFFIDGNKILFEKQNPKKAMKYYNWGINYLPYDKALLLARGICRFETGDKEGARQDWERIKTLGGFDIENWDMTENVKELKSYDELTSFF